jgi:ABC-2 type transport system permease protein
MSADGSEDAAGATGGPADGRPGGTAAVAETAGPAGAETAGPAGAGLESRGDAVGTGSAGPAETAAAVPGYLRFLRSELRLVFRRRRNQLLLLVVALFPLLIGIGLKVAAPHGGGGGGGPSTGAAFFNQLAGNGVFLTFIALTTLLILVLPVVVAVVSGDSVAGEAGYGTLRYLLAVPAGRTRLLSVKYLSIVAFALCATFIVAIVALLVGVALFPVGPVTLLSGTTVSLADGLLRVLLVTLYVSVAMAAVGAIGLAISTLTEHAIGAIAAVMILVVASEVVDQVPQFAAVGPYLPTHWWNMFDSLLRTPVDTTTLWHGLLSFVVYAVLFCLFAWARFSSSDVTS